MKIVKWFMFVVMVLLPVLVSAQDKMKDYPVTDSSISLDSQAFKGFEKCRISHQLSGVKARFIKSGKPEKKEKQAWTYAVKAEVLGLPVKALMVGVCDDHGEQACGWSAFTAAVIAISFEEAKKHLKKKYGIDYTLEKRSKESDISLHPVLVPGKKSNECILFCDPGIL